jgi:cytochrome c oxidase subunit 4
MDMNDTNTSHASHVHIPTVGTLVSVFAALITLTFVTAWVATIQLGELNIIVALAIACTKASLVAWIFMGVRYTSQLTKLFCVAGIVFLTILLCFTFSDYGSRSWTYHAKPWATNASKGTSKFLDKEKPKEVKPAEGPDDKPPVF